MKDGEGAFLGIGFWAGMGAMSLINFCGSIIFDRNYYTIRYSLVMLFISIVFVTIGLIYLNKANRRDKRRVNRPR